MTERIDLSKSDQYTLSIRLSADGFSFSIYNPLGGSDFYFQPYPIHTQHSLAANVKSFLAETEELSLPYRQTNLLIHSSRYTPVPLELYEDEQMDTLFYQNLPRQNNEVILCNILGRSNSVVLFSLDKLTHVFLSEKFPEARFFAAISPQIEYLAARSKQGNNRKLFANLHPASIDVLAFDKGKQLLLNTYSIRETADQCYYILNVWKELGYDQERDELHLAGNQPKKELQQMLQPYLRHVYIINPQAELNDSEASRIEEIPFDMQSLISCE